MRGRAGRGKPRTPQAGKNRQIAPELLKLRYFAAIRLKARLRLLRREWVSMGINLVFAVTDDDWFEMLRQHPKLREVNSIDAISRVIREIPGIPAGGSYVWNE
jgi:hypothetical protein